MIGVNQLKTTALLGLLNGNPAMSPLLIVNPLAVEGLQALFRTHPATEERIKRLQAIASQHGQALSGSMV
jgi:heat shock protein HtpX